MLTIEERLALNSDQQTSVRLQLKGYKDILQDLETERKVLEERLALNSDQQQTSVRLRLKGYKNTLKDLEIEREVLLEEQQAQAEYASVRGISAPDF